MKRARLLRIKWEAMLAADVTRAVCREKRW